MNPSIIIKFSGIERDFDGEKSRCEWDIPSNPYEKVQDLISRFFQISGINKDKHRLYYNNNQNLENYKLYTLSQINLIHNSIINISYIEFESLSDGKMLINIKFIKFSQYSAFNCYKELKGILKLSLLNEIASKIDDSYLDQVHIMKYIPDNIYYILKILKNSDFNKDNEATKAIEKILAKENGCNIINFSNFVEEQIDQKWMQQIMNFVPKNYLNEINDTNFRLGKYQNYLLLFETELARSLQLSVFEFSPVSLVILDRKDYDDFENERRKCPNRRDRLLYHGTQIHSISSILTDIFKRSETSGYQHGKGVYFTDSLDTCWFYGGMGNNRSNMNKIPKIGDTFTGIASIIYYDKKGFLQVENYKGRPIPGKNEINFAFAGSNSETVINPDKTKFTGTEYVIWDYNQMCPFISIKFKREEFCVIWRDDNFSEKPVFNDEFDEIFKKFLKERIKYIKQEAKFNVYPCKTTQEALEIVNRKKYNKIILISNVGPNYGGKDFVDKARKIIGNDVIVLFLAYNINHLNWIKTYKNALFSNEPKFYEEYLESFTKEPEIVDNMKKLILKVENHYKVKFNFDNNYLHFPLYKEEGFYSDLLF